MRRPPTKLHAPDTRQASPPSAASQLYLLCAPRRMTNALHSLAAEDQGSPASPSVQRVEYTEAELRMSVYVNEPVAR